MGETCNTHGTDDKYNLFVGKPEGKRQYGRPSRKLEDNTRTDLEK